jgi:hypothetical protein
MHKWIGEDTGTLKKSIKSGELQKVYSDLFKQD